jgi:hypothetical protein
MLSFDAILLFIQLDPSLMLSTILRASLSSMTSSASVTGYSPAYRCDVAISVM